MNRRKVLIVDRPELSLKTAHAIRKLKLETDVMEVSRLVEARKALLDSPPEVMFLGAEIEEQRGSYFLKKVMQHLPVPVVMVADDPSKEFRSECLLVGAIDVLDRRDFRRMSAEHIERLKRDILESKSLMERKRLFGKNELSSERKREKRRKFSIIAIGASTGGTEAIASIMKRLPAGLPPIVIAQHMPPKFTASFAQRLNAIGPVRVKEAEVGDVCEKGWAYVAPGRKHMAVKRFPSQSKLEIIEDLGDHRYSPSVDVLFHSVARHYGTSALSLILTGMGKDGAKGMLDIKHRGGHTIAQNESSSAIYGMPKEAMLLGACDMDLDLDKIPDYIQQLFLP